MNNGHATALDPERDAFERAYVLLDDASPFAIEVVRKLRRPDGGYYSASADFAWMGWKIGRKPFAGMLNRVRVAELLDYASSYGTFSETTPNGTLCQYGGSPMDDARRAAIVGYKNVLGFIPPETLVLGVSSDTAKDDLGFVRENLRLTEAGLRDLIADEDDDEALDDCIATHDGEWRRVVETYQFWRAPNVDAPEPEPTHPDDIAVDRFAAAMKAKLAIKRAEGCDGWGDCDLVSAADLSAMLREHVDKGDPLDVGAFAMMLHQRGDKVEPAPTEPLVEVAALAHAEGRKCGLEIARHAYEAHDRAGRDWVRDSLYDTLNREGAERVQAAANRMGAAPLAATVDDLLGALRAILIGQEGARERGQLAITRASARQP